MAFPNYRHCCLLLILTSYYHVTSSIIVNDPMPEEQDADDGNTADDTGLEKAGEEDEENKHFMDVYSLQSGPKQLEFGHVFEDPNVWEQRYEKKDFDAQRHQGKVKWGDKDGSYGEQYWDLNHGGAEESTNNYNENGHYEETTPTDYVQESRHKAVVYKPVLVTLVKNKSKKPVRNYRNYSNRLLELTTEQSIVHLDKKIAPVLVFDMKTGVVMDEATGNKFILKSIDD